MRLENEKGLADDLERGIGEVHWNAFTWDSSLRLRLPLCGITSLALTEALQGQGYDARSVESTSDFGIEPGMKHVFTVLNNDGQQYIIDPTFSQFLDTVGLGTGYVTYGGEDLFPSRKIAIEPYEKGYEIAKSLARAATFFRMNRQPTKDFYLSLATYPMEDFTHDEVEDEYRKIWNPDNFDVFIPECEDDVKAGHQIAKFILPEHVKMIA